MSSMDDMQRNFTLETQRISTANYISLFRTIQECIDEGENVLLVLALTSLREALFGGSINSLLHANCLKGLELFTTLILENQEKAMELLSYMENMPLEMQEDFQRQLKNKLEKNGFITPSDDLLLRADIITEQMKHGKNSGN